MDSENVNAVVPGDASNTELKSTRENHLGLYWQDGTVYPKHPRLLAPVTNSSCVEILEETNIARALSHGFTVNITSTKWSLEPVPRHISLEPSKNRHAYSLPFSCQEKPSAPHIWNKMISLPCNPSPPSPPPLPPVSIQGLPAAKPSHHNPSLTVNTLSTHSVPLSTSSDHDVHASSIFHTINPLSASQVRAVLKQGLHHAQQQKQVTEMGCSTDVNVSTWPLAAKDGCSPVRKKLKLLTEYLADDGSSTVTQALPNEEARMHALVSNYAKCASQQSGGGGEGGGGGGTGGDGKKGILNATSIRLDEGLKYDERIVPSLTVPPVPTNLATLCDSSNHKTVPLTNNYRSPSPLQSDMFQLVPGSPCNATAESLTSEFFDDAIEDCASKHCYNEVAMDLGNSPNQELGCDDSEQFVPSWSKTLPVFSDQNKGVFLKRVRDYLGELVEPTRLNLSKPRLRLGLSKKQPRKPLHHVQL